MNNSIFIDSTLLVEYIKGSETNLLENLQNDPGFQLYINQTVVSEYLFYHLAIFGQKAPLTLKVSGQITEILKTVAPVPLLQNFNWLTDQSSILAAILSGV